ncbi:MAG: DsbA family protein [Gemmatimonadota bacterium]|jgi:predicted DsbA family dithiol-disulfide isomerase|nr:DsbA family protein [Gemmatimonadota bacterium]
MKPSPHSARSRSADGDENAQGEESIRPPLRVTVFSDFICSWSYLAEAVLREFSLGESAPGQIDLHFRARELYPASTQPSRPVWSDAEWGLISRFAAEAGVGIRKPGWRPFTRKAHEAAVFARDHGLELPFRQAVYALYWMEDADIGRIDLLVGVAGRTGLDPEKLRIALDLDLYAERVEAEGVLGDRLRIPGTPAIFPGTGASAKIILGGHPAVELRRLIRDAIEHGMENE